MRTTFNMARNSTRDNELVSAPINLPIRPYGNLRDYNITDAVRVCMSDCYARLFDRSDHKFLEKLFLAHPETTLSPDEAARLTRLVRRTEEANRRDPSLRAKAWYVPPPRNRTGREG